MTWIEVVATAGVLLLCAITYGMYRLKKAIENMYLGLGQLLGEHREVTRKILYQLDSGDAVPTPEPRFPLHVEVCTIKDDLRYFKNKWIELHISDFAKIEVEKRERQRKFLREDILDAVAAALGMLAGVAVERETDFPDSVPAGGLMIVRDGGDVFDPAFVSLDQFRLSVQVEVFVARSGATTTLNELRTAAVEAVLADRTLGGLAVDIPSWSLTELDTLHGEISALFEAISIAFIVDYRTR